MYIQPQVIGSDIPHRPTKHSIPSGIGKGEDTDLSFGWLDKLMYRPNTRSN